MKILVNFNGKKVLMRASTARALVRRGQATRVDQPVQVQQPAVIERVTKPVTDASSLRGEAKKAWLRHEIEQRGGEPSSTTIVALESQLRILKSMEN